MQYLRVSTWSVGLSSVVSDSNQDASNTRSVCCIQGNISIV